MAQAGLNWRVSLLVFVGLGWSSAAFATGEPRVQWSEQATAAAPCLNRQEVQLAVNQAIGRQLFVEQEPDLILRSQVRPKPPSVSLWLSDRAGHELGVRRLTAKSCDELTETAALVLSLMLDFDEVEFREKVRAAEAKAAKQTEAEIEGAEAAPSATPEPPRPERGRETSESRESGAGSRGAAPIAGASVALRGLLRSGLTPEPTTGAGVVAALLLAGDWQVALSGDYWPRRRFDVSDGVLRSSRWQVGADVCLPALQRGHLAATLCAGAHLAFVHAATTGFDANTSQNGAAFIPGLLVRLTEQVGVAFVSLDLGANYAARRVRLTLLTPRGTQSLFAMPQVSFGGGVALGVRSW